MKLSIGYIRVGPDPDMPEYPLIRRLHETSEKDQMDKLDDPAVSGNGTGDSSTG